MKGSELLEFGKHKGASFETIVQEQPNYTQYIIKTVFEDAADGEQSRRLSEGQLRFVVGL